MGARTNACRAAALALALGAGCSGTIDAGEHAGAARGAAADDDDATRRPGPEADAAAGDGQRAGEQRDPAGASTGQVTIHRLNNFEYDNTVRDLLGVTQTGARSFIADEQAAGFDNIAAALGMTDARYEQYVREAELLVDRVFADAALRARIITCEPDPPGEQACARSVIERFGARAYRRPLAADEVERLLELGAAALALGEDFDGAMAQVVRGMLSSAPFLYRAELAPQPASPGPSPLSAHELGARLSYLLWSTMPDARLFELAADGALLQDEVLAAEVARMLDDPRSARFVESFAGQWLGLRGLGGHRVDTTVFGEFDDGLRDAMVHEGLAFFAAFLDGERGMDEFFTADMNFVDADLAQLYGFAPGDHDPARASLHPDDGRRGFLGLASFLTLTSFSYRTAPTLRGKWVLENLLCTQVAQPPADVPQLDDAMEDPQALQSQNVRVRLAAHRSDPLCASCHRVLDPIGLGLENFDAIGAYRERYDNGDLVDATGELPDGASFDGLEELSALLAQDPRLLECASEKLLTYALSRALNDDDGPLLSELRARWHDDGLRLRSLLTEIVLSDAFRQRAGETL